MAKPKVQGREASFSTNRYWIIRNENEFVWNGVHWIRPTSKEVEEVIGFKLRKCAESFRKHLQSNRPDGMVEVVRAPYQVQIRIKRRAVDEGLKCVGKDDE